MSFACRIIIMLYRCGPKRPMHGHQRIFELEAASYVLSTSHDQSCSALPGSVDAGGWSNCVSNCFPPDRMLSVRIISDQSIEGPARRAPVAIDFSPFVGQILSLLTLCVGVSGTLLRE